MQVFMGNRSPLNVNHSEPAVYTWSGPEDYTHVAKGRPNGKDAGVQVLTSAVPRLPDHECFVSVVTDWPNHSPQPPAWVASDNDDLAQMLAEFYGCPVGIPDDVEDTHHTFSGPPGVGPKEGE